MHSMEFIFLFSVREIFSFKSIIFKNYLRIIWFNIFGAIPCYAQKLFTTLSKGRRLQGLAAPPQGFVYIQQKYQFQQYVGPPNMFTSGFVYLLIFCFGRPEVNILLKLAILQNCINYVNPAMLTQTLTIIHFSFFTIFKYLIGLFSKLVRS